MPQRIFVISKPDETATFKQALVAAGYEVAISDGNGHPEQKLEQLQPDVVVFSLRLPQADGQQILQALRMTSLSKEIPLLLLCDTHAKIATATDAERFGADDFLLYPVDPKLLIERIEVLLSKSTKDPGEVGAEAKDSENKAAQLVSSNSTTSTMQNLTLERKLIEDKYAQVCEGNYFSLLGLSLDAPGEAVLQAYQRMSQNFNPARFPEVLLEEYADRLTEIAAVLREAYRVLGNEAMREAYRGTLR